MKTKSLTCNVHRTGFGPNDQTTDSTNGGLSSRTWRVLLLAEDAPVPEGVDPATCLRVTKRFLFGSWYVHAEPAVAPPEGHVGWMFGGNLLDASDSRFRELTGCDYPIRIHDRSETTQDYARHAN